MDLLLQCIGLFLLTVGVVFLIMAGIGVARLPDAFQRMHASTKAGTLGASFSVIGAALLLPDIRLSSVGFTILFLLATLPVAAQLLARAAYKSGAHMRLTREDPLVDVLKREKSPLEDRAFAPGKKDD